jgi:hypothetical protein
MSDLRTPHSERWPFKQRHKTGTDEYNREFKEWQALCRFVDELNAEILLEKENPVEYARQKAAEEIVDAERRRMNTVDQRDRRKS